jgi:hypothetical protein
MPQIIIEELSRGGGHSCYHRVEKLPVRIGRALDNDIIIPDPYVSPLHVTIEEGTDCWMVIDRGSENGTFVGKNKKIEGAATLVSGDRLTVGRTQLRVWSSEHKSAPTLRLAVQQGSGGRLTIPLLACVSFMVTAAFLTLHLFLETAKQTIVITLFANAIPYLFFPILWAGIWACAGFILRRKSRFSLQFITANGALVCIIVITVSTEYFDYLSGSEKMASVFQYAAMALLSALLLFANLVIATGIADVRRALSALLIGGGVIAVIAIVDHAESFENRISPAYSRTLKPPYAKITRSITLDRFIKESETLFGDTEGTAHSSK